MTSFGPYEVISLVAEGSTGTVYQARHVELDRVAAIKELSPAVCGLPGFVERFRAEAEMLAGLDHPNIVALYDYVEEPDRAWIAEEWVSGASLDAVLGAHGRLTAEQSLGVLRGALMGLAHAHDAGLVHRDIASGNILADLAGTSKLVDFGLAAPVGEAGAQGTPAFISPEAASGRAVGKSSDVYSAASVLFMLLAGRPPFPAADAATVLQAHIQDPAPSLSGHGDDLRDLLRRSMDKDAAVRPPDAAAFLAELEEAARKRFGAGWLERASIAGLVGAAVAGAGKAAGASTSVAARPTGAIDTVAIATAAVTGAAPPAQAAVAGAKRGLRRFSLGTAVGLAAAAVLVLGGGAVAAVKLAGGSGAGDSKTNSGSHSPAGKRRSFAELAPTGAYTYQEVVVSSTIPGYRPGSVVTSTWTFKPSCTATTCKGTLTSTEQFRSPNHTYTWDGARLVVSDRPPARFVLPCTKGGVDRFFTRALITIDYARSPLLLTQSRATDALGQPEKLTGTVTGTLTQSDEEDPNGPITCGERRTGKVVYKVTLTRGAAGPAASQSPSPTPSAAPS